MTDTTAPAPKAELKGIGGWLGFMGIGLVLGSFRSIVTMASEWLDKDTLAAFAKFPTGMNGLLTIEAGVLALLAVVLVAYFGQRRYFVRIYTVFVAYSFVVLPLECFWASLTMPMTFEQAAGFVFTPGAIGRLIGSAIITLPWLIYVYVSKRVRNTFVN